MSFLQMNIKKKYRTSDTFNIAESFIEPIIKECSMYKRAVGFFSSSSLIYTSRGLAKLAESYDGGEPIIQYVVSPRLTKEDAEAIESGYANREKIIEDALVRDFHEVSDPFHKERLNMISHLISTGAMDIKVAVTEVGGKIGMYHEKIGIFYDKEGNKIAFTGSLNESLNAYLNNFESIRVYRSWEGEDEDCFDIEYDFNNLWNDTTKKVKIISFPLAAKEKLFQYKKETYDPDIDEHETEYLRNTIDFSSARPKIPDDITLHDYQKDAIREWFRHKCCGIFDMATGTGKTYTAYGAIIKLLEKANYKMATVILCPYQHLVEQWAEDAPKFGINDMIIGYSSAKHAHYLTKLKKAIQDYNDGLIDNFFFICTNASFKLDKVQNELDKLKGRALLVADEAHNLGAKKIQNCLKNLFTYRLALSATVERYRDEEGTQIIFDYFGEKCIEYPMSRAIIEDKLTKYYYHPIVVTLNNEEIEEYVRLTKLVRQNSFPTKNGKVELTKMGEMYAIQRARLIAGCSNKIEALKEEMKNHLHEKNMLVYCGTSKLADDNGDEIKQIDKVCKILGNELSMSIDRYTSRESADERMEIKKRFQSGFLQALVAIKCLDEGVNIPGIKTAFILASSTNPREYIQRRGRVLRKAKGKLHAIIYDFVTLPFDVENLQASDQYMVDDFKSLAINEINRLEEFGNLSLNPTETIELIEHIKTAFHLNEFALSEEMESFEWDESNYE